MLRLPRDHDIVEDVNNRFLVVVGNLHPPNRLIAYLKYIKTYEETIWKHGNTYYERVLKTYGVKSLHKYVSKYQEFTYDEVLGTHVPTINLSSIRTYHYPEVRFREIRSKASDELEYAVLNFTDTLRMYVKNVNNYIGVTGSLLTKTHNVRVSDIDVVLYGCKCSMDFMESLSNFRTVRPSYAELSKHSILHDLPLDALVDIYPPFKKLIVGDKVINVIFVDDSQPPRYGSEIYVNLHPVELVVDVEPHNCSSLFYPSTATIERVVESQSPKLYDLHNIGSVVSYEGIYSYALYRGGRLRVRGILQKVISSGKHRVLVGGIEEPGYVIPY